MRVSKTLLVIFAAIAWCAASAAGVPVAWAEAVRVDAHPVALNADDASQTIAGQLDYRGGLALSSPDPRFGGFSALGVSADVLLFDKDERGPADALRLQFEALRQFDQEELQVAQQVLESLILKHQAKQMVLRTQHPPSANEERKRVVGRR